MQILSECLLHNCLFVHFTDPIIDDPFISSVVSLMSEEKDYLYIFVCPTHRYFHCCRGGNVCVFDDQSRCLMTKIHHVWRDYSAERSILYHTEIQKPVRSKAVNENSEDFDEVDRRFNTVVFIETLKEHMENNGISSALQNSIVGMDGPLYSMVGQLYRMFRNSLKKDKKKSPMNISERFDMAAGRIFIIADSITKHIKRAELSQKRRKKIFQNSQRSTTAFQKDVQVLISAYLLHGQTLPAVQSHINWQDIRNTKALWQKKAPVSYWRYKNVKSGRKLCAKSSRDNIEIR